MDSTAVCERCGAVFAPTTAVEEVVSARVLCPRCVAQKRAQRAARASGAKPAAAVKAASPPPASPPPARATAARSATTSTKAGAAPAKTASDAGAPRSRRHHIEALEADNKAVKIGWIIALVCLVGGGAVLYGAFKTQRDRQEAKERYEASLKDLQAKLAAMNLETMEGAQAAEALIEETKDTWLDSEIEATVQDVKLRAAQAIQRLNIAEETRKKLADIVAALQAEHTTDELLQLNRRIVELQPKAREVGQDFVDQLTATRKSLDSALVGRLAADAQEAASKGGGWQAVMAIYAKAEDELQRLAQQAASDKDPEAQKRAQGERVKVIQESDRYGESVFTPELIDRVPTRDLLTGDAAKDWLVSGQLEHRIDSGQLVLIGPPDAGKRGALSTSQTMRDLVLDAELTLDRGKVELFFRVGEKADSKLVPTVTIGEGGDISVPPNTQARITISLIGSRIQATYNGQVVPLQDVPIQKSRKGYLTIVPDKGVTAKFTRLSIRELR